MKRKWHDDPLCLQPESTAMTEGEVQQINKLFDFLKEERIWQVMLLVWILSECATIFLLVSAEFELMHPVAYFWTILMTLPIGISIVVGALRSAFICHSRYLADRRNEEYEQRLVSRLEKEFRFTKFEPGTRDGGRRFIYRLVERIARQEGVPIARAQELAMRLGEPYTLLKE